MNLFRVPVEIVSHNVARAPCKNLRSRTRVNEPIVGRNACYILRMQPAHANQAKMIGTIHMKCSANACYNNILLATICEAHDSRHMIANEPDRTIASKQSATRHCEQLWLYELLFVLCVCRPKDDFHSMMPLHYNLNIYNQLLFFAAIVCCNRTHGVYVECIDSSARVNVDNSTKYMDARYLRKTSIVRIEHWCARQKLTAICPI